MPRSWRAPDLSVGLGLGLGRRSPSSVRSAAVNRRCCRTSQSRGHRDNALTANALTANALTANALSANALSANALSANALTANALTANALRDPLAREFLKYVVSCALDDGDSDHDAHRRADATRSRARSGLAPEWGRDARLVRRRVPALGLGLRARARRRRRRRARDLDARRQPRAAPARQRAAQLHRARGDVLRQRVHPGPAALPLPVARARPATSASAAIRSTTAR